MKSCPNHNDEAYKLLEQNLGKEGAYRIFVANNEELPNLETVKAIINIPQQTSKAVQSEVDKIVEELSEKANKEQILTTINDFFSIAKSRLQKLIKNKNYTRLKELLTPELGLNKLESITDTLKEAQKAEDDAEGLLRKTRAIALSIIQTEQITDLITEDVKSILADKDNALQNITTLQYYLYTLKDFELSLNDAAKTFEGNPNTLSKINNTIGKIKSIENQIVQNDISGLIEAFKPILAPKSKEYRQLLQKEVDRLDTLASKTKNIEDKKRYTNLSSSLQTKIKQFDFDVNDNIASFLKGERGDTNAYSAFLEAFSDSPDPIVGSFTVWLKNQIADINSEVQPIEKEYEHELAPIYKELGKRFNPEDLGKQVTFEDKRIDWDGNEYKVVQLLNPFQNYQADEQNYINSVENLKKLIRDGENIEENTQKLIQAKKDYTLWRLENMNMEYKPEYYKKYELWEDEIGQELKQEVDDIFDQIKQIQAPSLTIGSELSEQDYNDIDALLLEYKLLGNLNNLDGSSKTGSSLNKAKRMQEVRALNREFFEFKDNIPAFEKAKQRHSEQLLSTGLLESSQEYRDGMQKWEQENTRFVIKDSFYKKREAITKEIDYITKKFKNEKIQQNIKELWDTIQSITYGLRDEDGQPIGILVQEKGAERIKLAQEALQDLQDKVTQISGLTKEEQSLLNDLFTKSKSGVITQEEREDLSNLLEKSKAEGLSKSDKERLFKLFSELKDLQSNIPTEYYIQVANNLTSKYGVSLLDNGEVLQEDGGGTKVVPFLDSPKLNDLLEHRDFKEWFDLNHIQVEKFNPNTKQVEQKWQRTYQWNRIIPNDEEYVDVKPAQKYSYRVVKDKYKTDKVVGKTVDNKGNFIPLDKNNQYRNKEYYRLKNSTLQTDKELFKLLQVHTDYLLKAQEDIADRNKLWLDVPKRRKESFEKFQSLINKLKEKPLDFPNLLWTSIKDKIQSLTDFNSDEGNFESVFADKYGNEFTSVPIKYTGKLESENVSLDIFKSIMKYMYSAKVNKKLVELSPVATALERVLSQPEYKPKDLSKTIKGRLGNPLGKTNVRLSAVQNIVRRQFEGQEKKYELGQKVEAVLGAIKGLTVIKTIAFDIPASIANVVNAEYQNFINSSNGYISKKNLGKAHSIFLTEWFPAFQKDYFENKLGEKSLQSQLFDLYEFVQSHSFEEHVGSKLSQSKIKDALTLNWLRNHREWGELFVQTLNGLAYLDATKIEQTNSDKSKNTISLLQAYELDEDGIVKLKDGISKEWGFNGAKFKELKERIEKHNSRVHGNYAKGVDKPESETYTLFSVFIMMKRFFTSMFLNRFASADVEVTKYGVKANPRFNVRSGSDFGYYIQTLSAFQKEFESKFQTGEFQTLSEEDKRAMFKSLMDISTIIIASLLMKFLFGFNPDDKDKYKKLKEKAWYELQLMYQLSRLQLETSTFLNPSQYGGFLFDSPIIYQTYKDWKDLIAYSIGNLTGDTKSYYEKDYGLYKKGESKAKARLFKVTGLEKIMKAGDEEQLVKDYLKMRAR